MNVEEGSLKENSSRKTVFLYLSLRSYMSDLLQTSYIKYLSEKYRVVVFLKKMKDDNDPEERYYKNDNITYITIDLPKSRFWMFFDVYLRNELIHSFDNNIAVQWRNKRTTNKLRLKFRKLVRFLPKKLFSPKFFLNIEALLVPGYGQFKMHVQHYRPSLILTATPGIQPFDAYAVLCARKAKIPSVAINFSWDNLTSIPRHVRKTDYAIAWNEWIKKQALKFHGYNSEDVFVSGTLRFDHYFRSSPFDADRETFLESKGLDPRYKTIFSTARTYSTFSLDFIRAFINWRNKNVFLEPLNLLIRVHPLDSIEDYKEFQGESNICIEYGSEEVRQDATSKGHKVEMDEKDLVNMKNTLRHIDVQVTITSTVSIEGCIFDKPVINSGFANEFSVILDFLHYKPVVEKGAVRVADTMEEVKDLISMYLKDPRIDMEGRKAIVDMLIKPTDGYSYKRSVDFLASILDRRIGRKNG